jgi:hypothetical protein
MTKRILTTGDLVQVHNTAFKYFAGRLALVDHMAHIEEFYDDDGNLQSRIYYLITLADNSASHIFPHDHLILVSKAQKKNE